MALQRRVHGAVTAWNAVSQSFAYSTAATAGDACFLVADNTVTFNDTLTGWTELATGGTGAGYTKKVFRLNGDYAGTPALPTLTAASAGEGVGYIEHWFDDGGLTIDSSAVLIALDDVLTSTAFSATGSSMTTATGDTILTALALKSQATMTAAPSAIVLSQGGATLGTQVANFGTRTITGINPATSLHVGTYHKPVTTGGTGTPSLTATGGAGSTNVGGTAAFIRLRGVFTNVPPTANAGSDQSVTPGTLVTLNGTGSSDTDGTIATYAWTQTSGTAVTLSSSSVASPTFTPATTGVRVFQLVVTDDDGAASSADSVTITVATPGAYVPPTGTGNVVSNSATSGATLSVNKPANLADDDTLILAAYKQAPGTTFTTPSGFTAAYTAAAVGTRGLEVFAKRVTTASGEPSSYSITASDATARWILMAFRLPGLNATWLDAAPTSDAYSGSSSSSVADPSVTAVAATTLALAVNFTNNSTAIYQSFSLAGWTNLANATVTSGASTSVLDVEYKELTSGGATGVSTFAMTPAAASSGGFQLTLKLAGATNVAPTANAGPDQVVSPSVIVSLDGTGSSDPDGTISTYTWTQISGPAVTLSSTSIASPTFTAPSSAAALVFGLTVTDNSGATASQDTVSVTVTGFPTFVGHGAVFGVTTSAVADLPAGIAARDIAILGVSSDVAAIGAAAAGWLPLGSVFSGGGMNHRLWYRHLTGSESLTSSTVVASIPLGSKGVSFTTVYRPVGGSTYLWPLLSQGADTDNSSTAVAVSGSSITTTANDLLVAYVTALAAATAFTAVVTGAALTQATMDVQAQRVSARSGSNTISYGLWDRPVLTGATAAPAFTATAVGDNATAAVSFIRLREAANVAPTANAGVDQSVATGALTTLNGSASSDPEGEPLSYAWTQTAGTTVTLSSASAASPTFTPATAGVRTFQLVVTDGTGATSTDTVAITVTSGNVPPTANAGVDQTILVGNLVTLNGTGSTDPDGTIASYLWSQTAGTAVTLSSTTTASPTFTPATAGVRTFSLVVTDDGGATSTADLVTITVNATDSVSYVGVGAAGVLTTAGILTYPTVAAGDICLAFASSDSVNIPATLATGWNQIGTIITGGGVSERVWYRIAAGTEGGTTITLSGVTLGTKGVCFINAFRSSTGAFTTPVGVGGTDTDTSSTAFAVAGSAADSVVGDRVAAGWASIAPTGSYTGTPTGQTITQSGGTITTNPRTGSGSVSASTVSYGSSDGGVTVGSSGAFAFAATTVGANAAGVARLILLHAVTNVPPTADAGVDQGVPTGSLVTLDGIGSSDPDGTIVNYAWTQISGTAVTLSSTSAASPTFTPATDGVRVFGLVVTDNLGAASTQDTVTITASTGDIATAGADQSVAAWDLVTLVGTGSAVGAWTQTSGATVTLGGSGATRTFKAVPSNTPGVSVVRIFRYTVGTATDDVQITTASAKLFFMSGSGLHAADETMDTAVAALFGEGLYGEGPYGD